VSEERKPKLNARERQELVCQFLPLARHFVGRFKHLPAVRRSRADAFQFACLVLSRAVHHFDPDKAEASTYFWCALKREFARYHDHFIRRPRSAESAIDAPRVAFSNGHTEAAPARTEQPPTADAADNTSSVVAYLALLPVREADMIARFYGLHGLPRQTADEIAADIGLTPGSVQARVKRSVRRLQILLGVRGGN
jgi:RNA polymerase sigma factor (sigma-70 family)